MDETRDDTAPGGEPEPRKDEAPGSVPPSQPRWWVDGHGNVKGPIFSFSSEHLAIYTDEAITDPAELAKLRKPRD